MNREVVYIPGPLHPDLFGGETPILQAVAIEEIKDKEFTVVVTCTATCEFTVRAPDRETAEQKAMDCAAVHLDAAAFDDITIEEIECTDARLPRDIRDEL